jgi:uncharacterized protein YqgV (UPF0045/DUF77 family)
MARASFTGPVLVGDIRSGQFRDIGYSELVQGNTMVLTNTTANTAGYGGSSGVFIQNNAIMNAPATVYTQGTTTYAPQTITADSASLIYRGCVFYVPVGADLHDVLIDMQVIPTATGGSVTGVTAYVSNKFETSSGVYFQTGSLTSVGRGALATFTAAQMAAQQATTADIIQNNGQPNVSQVVVTLAIAGTTMGALTAGTFNITLRYATPDNNIGNLTTYPYGNIAG